MNCPWSSTSPTAFQEAVPEGPVERREVDVGDRESLAGLGGSSAQNSRWRFMCSTFR